MPIGSLVNAAVVTGKAEAQIEGLKLISGEKPTDCDTCFSNVQS
jgi:hypothetical protein